VLRRLVVASNNSDKFREILEKLSPLPLALQNLADFLWVEKVVEDQPDLLGNAIKKATAVAQATGLWALADDTGLEVDALHGAPGVLSARYSGSGATYQSNCEKLLRDLHDIPDGQRQARFRCILCLKTEDGLYCVEGKIEGSIGHSPHGNSGFGYDPIFVLRSGQTLAELSLDEKNAISHRGQALNKMTDLLKFLLK
jgi:XTP/dITP diphosphohydrolase